MQFSEKQLGELFIQNYKLEDYLPLKRFRTSRLRHETEKPTLEDTRADYVVSWPNRLLWVVEFKIVADPGAIKQALEYYDCFQYDFDPLFFSLGKVSIAAQFFREDTIFFAQRLGVELIQISPINYKSATINLITRDRKITDTELNTRIKGFKQLYGVARG